jgi:predicted branched-subunit amino acid permease
LSAFVQHIEYRRGAREMAAPVLGMAAWGLVTGVAMVKSGLTVAQALAMTLFVFAGSAQLASLPLIAAGAPLWVLLLTAFCVNLRFVIFSAQWQPYFGHLPLRQRLLMMYVAGDVTYVNFLRRYPEARAQPGQVEYYWGAVHVNWLGWQSASVLGVLAADAVPTHWGLGFRRRAGPARPGLLADERARAAVGGAGGRCGVDRHLPPAPAPEHRLRHRGGRRAGLVAGPAP